MQYSNISYDDDHCLSHSKWHGEQETGLLDLNDNNATRVTATPTSTSYTAILLWDLLQ